MNRGILLGVVPPISWLALLAFLGATSPTAYAAPTKTNVDLRQHPTGGKTPIDVSVGLYVTNLVAIDETRENFEVGGYLIGKWLDPRLALPAVGISGDAEERNASRTFQVEEIWTPAIQAANSVSHKTNSYSLEVDRNGAVTYVERFDAVLSNDYALRKFPFDTQVLRFEFQPFLSSASEIRFASQALPSTGISPEQHTELAAWRVIDLRYTAEKVTGNTFVPPTGEALFQIFIERRSGFYVWKIFLPLLMLTLIPTVVFWIDVKEFDWILKVPMTMLLSMVAFEFTIARDLPRIGYVTFLDAVFLESFAFCFFCILEITVVFLMNGRGRRSAAVKLHSAGRWAYPLAYLSVLSLLAVCFLV
jgi:Neurotransmitter-gated ion-channel ligand binding domain